MNNIYLQNNSNVNKYYIKSLGFNLIFEDNTTFYNILNEFDFENDLCGNEDFLELIKNNHIIIYKDNRLLNLEESIELFTLTNNLDDLDNEKQYYKKDNKIVIPNYTQLYIKYRPLLLDENTTIELEEGSDLIVDFF